MPSPHPVQNLDTKQHTLTKLFTFLAFCPLCGCGYFGFPYWDGGNIDSSENHEEGHKLVVDWPHSCSPKKWWGLWLSGQHDENWDEDGYYTCTDKNQINLCCSQSYLYTYKNQNKTEILYLWCIRSKSKQTHSSYDYKHIKLCVPLTIFFPPLHMHTFFTHAHAHPHMHSYTNTYTHTGNTNKSHHTGKLCI